MIFDPLSGPYRQRDFDGALLGEGLLSTAIGERVTLGYVYIREKLSKEALLDIQAIVKELKRERDRLNRAIAALEETDLPPAPRMPPAAKPPASPARRPNRLTPEGSKRLSELMKKRWAERRKNAARKGR